MPQCRGLGLIRGDAFIDECKQNAWGATCHASWIGSQVDEMLANLQKLQAQDPALEAEIKELEAKLDSHTYDNREKRKGLQQRRNGLAKQMEYLGASIQQAQRSMQQLHASAESQLALATFAETWKWKEVESNRQDVGDATGSGQEGNSPRQ